MTVCIAAMFNWNYAPPGSPAEYGKAILTASDRMITAGDVEYEPQQLKVAHITTHVAILIAGDYDTHSEAIRRVHDHVRNNANAKPLDVALTYGRAIQAIRQRRAEDVILAPLGLNTDSFLAQQKDMSASFVSSMTAQLQDFQGPDVEGLVVGTEGRIANIYVVDRNGTPHCYDDVGFAAIGIGAWHARSRMMQMGYVNNMYLPQAIAAVYSAKKAAEVAPGIGKATDMHIVTDKAIVPLHHDIHTETERLYKEYDEKRQALSNEAVEKLNGFLLDAQAKAAREQEAFRAISQADSSEAGSGVVGGSENAPKGPAVIQG